MSKIRFFICNKSKDANQRAKVLRTDGYETEVTKSKNQGLRTHHANGKAVRRYTVWGWIRTIEYFPRPGRTKRTPTEKELKDIENNGL